MYGASDRRSVSAGQFRSNDLLEARESARAGNELFEFTQLGRCRRAQLACNITYYLYYAFLLSFIKIYQYYASIPKKFWICKLKQHILILIIILIRHTHNYTQLLFS